MKKVFWKSKTFWATFLTVVITGYNTLGVEYLGAPKLPDFVYAVLGAFGLWGRTQATEPLGLSEIGTEKQP
jgi:hypothetical protein